MILLTCDIFLCMAFVLAEDIDFPILKKPSYPGNASGKELILDECWVSRDREMGDIKCLQTHTNPRGGQTDRF
jgi:hypothetical protein